MKKIISVIMATLLCISVIIVHATVEKETPAKNHDNIFTDVKESDWYYDDVKYVQLNGLMNGTSETEFSPAGVTTRGMIVTILWRLEGEPNEEGKAFEDVKEDAYYHKAVSWASNNQIVSGYSETTFGPDDIATREQLATIMYRYASYKKCDLSKKAELDKYEDKEQISEYAVESIKWANANGIISGTSETTISPKDNVLRSQVAAILRRFCESFKIFEDVAEEKKETTENKKESGNAGNNSPTVSGGIIGAGSFGDEDENIESGDQEGEIIPDVKDEVEEQRATLNVKTVNGNPGENVKVLVDLEKNPGILGMILQIEYDEDAMTLVGAENGEAIEDVLTLTTSKELSSGAKFVWDGLEVDSSQIKDGTVLKLEFSLSGDVIYGKRYPLTLKYTSGDIIDSNFASVNPLINQGFIEINQEEYLDQEEY